MLIDISPLLSPRLAVWPGDVPLSREVSCDTAKGDNLTLSSLTSTCHLGAHADAPSHYGGRDGIDAADLSRYVGTCQVIRVAVGRGERVTPAMLPEEIRAGRVLIATGTFPDPERFATDFAALSVELVEHLADRGVALVGIDTPSVDVFACKELVAHKAILRRGIAILEGLVLAHVEPGEYELIALPLRLAGFDASPVRAVLRR